MILKNAFIPDKNNYFDIKIENGIIIDIDKSINGEGIDLKGKILSRGLIDMHCHLREPGFEYKETLETGIASAIHGGYCAICPMANTNPVCDNNGILEYIIDLRTRQSIGRIQTTELHIGDHRNLGRYTEANGKQTQGY